RYLNFSGLQLYCHRVAGVVGALAAGIFGYRNAKTLEYAEKLGLAFQLTNIIRDVGEDAEEPHLSSHGRAEGKRSDGGGHSQRESHREFRAPDALPGRARPALLRRGPRAPPGGGPPRATPRSDDGRDLS